jgi:hypothetical protein
MMMPTLGDSLVAMASSLAESAHHMQAACLVNCRLLGELAPQGA